MSYAKSLGKEEEKLYAKALESGSAVTYVDESGERQKGMTAALEEMAGGYKSIYEEQLAANAAAAAMAAQNAAAEAESAGRAVTEEYGAVNKGLYRQYRKALASLPQELAAMGYTGGTSESSRVELERGYEEELGSNERARLTARGDIRDAEAAAVREGQQAAGKADAAARREYLNAMMALKEQAWADEQERAEALAATGDFSGYERLGYSSEQIEQLRTAWEAKNPELSIAIAALGGRYSADEVAGKPTSWVQQYLNALGYGLKVNGKWDSATENAYKAVFGRGSGRYVPPPRYYGTKKEEEKTEKKDSKRSGSAGEIRVQSSGGSAGTIQVQSGSSGSIRVKTSR